MLLNEQLGSRSSATSQINDFLSMALLVFLEILSS